VIAQRVLSGLSALLLATGVVQGVRGGWIHAKAGLAQVLLHRSWERTQAGGMEEKPWPWADTWPVARLTLPGGGEHIVLAGATGRNLAFAPGHLDGSSEPGGGGTCVIAGHRDTHFADLDSLEKGQTVVLEDAGGRSRSYRVVTMAVVEERDTWVITDNDGPTLVLVTCWPLDSPLPGGSQRYVVWAKEELPNHPPTAIRVDGYTAHTFDNPDAGPDCLAVKP
jgi:sortase A